MRNLTIKRIKSFVACLAKMKIYIEDPNSPDITVNNVPCRKLGDLKNGEEKTFQVEEQALKVFVIADTLSKEYCNEFYLLPEGADDVVLTGKNKYNPANGNAFRFDNNENHEVLINRKKGNRIGAIVISLAILVGAVGGALIGVSIFSEKKATPKTFTNEGMSITLSDEFKENDVGGYTAVYDSKKVAVFVLKEDFTFVEGFENYTLEQYAKLVITSNNLGDPEVKTVDEVAIFEYEYKNTENNNTYKYFSYVYKADDAFWLVQFAVRDNAVDKYEAKIEEWASSVRFSK